MDYKIVDSLDSLHLGDNSLTHVPLSQDQWSYSAVRHTVHVVLVVRSVVCEEARVW